MVIAMTTGPRTAKEIFVELVSHVPPEQWDERLEAECQGDGQLLSRVRALLRAHADPGSFLDQPAIGGDATAVREASITEHPGTIIGPYKLLQQIGEGGMGVVFMAEQNEPIQRTVALKIIKPGMDTRQVIARFEAERQALAMMEHPNIARVLDAGTTGGGSRDKGQRPIAENASSLALDSRLSTLDHSSGRPYFVMELVKGVAITKYCDEKHLPLRARLELFTQVCQAVQHAHQKGIIHRDIKPNNVLVAEYDNRAVPKVIDFGVAKATAQRLTERTMFTEFGQVLGTMEYMSPEQAKLNQLDIDTRSDIYSLGVLLYELLAGSTPFEGKRLKEAAFDEMLRIIREEEPQKPSTRLSTSDALPSIAANRGLEPLKLNRLVQGELDWIVMKALEKDRSRRYETANSFAQDLERYLADEPVQACPPSAAYRLRKLLRRNKAAVFTAALVAASLVLGTVTSVWQATLARRAETLAEQRLAAEQQARQRATAINDLLKQMLQSASPDASKGATYTVRQMLDDFAARLDDQLKDQPAVEAAIRATIGEAYAEMEQHDKAEPHLKTALELRKRVFGHDSAEVADSLVDYAWLANRRSKAEMESLAREAVEIQQRLRVPANETVRALSALAFSLCYKGKTKERDEIVAQILAIEPLHPAEQADVASVLHWVADDEIAQGNFREAELLARQSVALHRKVEGEHHPETAWGLNSLADALNGQDKLDEAETTYRQSLDILREHYEDNQFPVVVVSGGLLGIARAKGDDVAIDKIRRTAEKALANTSTNSATLYRTGLIFIDLEQWVQAEQCFARSAGLVPSIARRYYVALLQLTRHDIDAYRATCQAGLTQSKQALDAASYYYAAWTCLLSPDSGVDFERVTELANRALKAAPTASGYRQAVAIAHYRAGRFQKAHEELVASIDADSGDDKQNLQVVYCRLFLAMTQQQLNRLDDARKSLQLAQEGVDALLGDRNLPWQRRLTLKLWRDEAERLVMVAGEERAVSPNPADTSVDVPAETLTAESGNE